MGQWPVSTQTWTGDLGWGLTGTEASARGGDRGMAGVPRWGGAVGGSPSPEARRRSLALGQAAVS